MFGQKTPPPPPTSGYGANRAGAGSSSPPPLATKATNGPTQRNGKAPKFKQKELIKMFRSLASMLRAQINTADALKYYAKGLPNPHLSATLDRIREDIHAGVSVHEAFRRSGQFSDLIIGLIHAGGDAGRLDEAFRALAKRTEADMRLRKRLKTATLIPSVVISVLVLAFIFSQVRIVPQIEDLLDSVGAEPDGFIKIIFTTSHFFQASWPFMLIGAVTLALCIAFIAPVRGFIMNLLLSRWRLLRHLIMSIRQMTVLGTVHLLHSNGINLAKSVRTAATAVRETPLYHELMLVAEKYHKSAVPLSVALEKYSSVDEQVCHMISIGEKSASVAIQLELLTEMYEEDSDNLMNEFTTLVNFLVLIIAVVCVSAVFLGTFLPIFLMGPKMMQGAM